MSYYEQQKATKRAFNEAKYQRDMMREYDSENEDVYIKGELVQAAMMYANLAMDQIKHRDYTWVDDISPNQLSNDPYWVGTGGITSGYNVPPNAGPPPGWPLKSSWNPYAPTQNLSRAMALLSAELERLERQDKKFYLKPKRKRKKVDVDPIALATNTNYNAIANGVLTNNLTGAALWKPIQSLTVAPPGGTSGP